MLRDGFILFCIDCKMENYISKKNKKNILEKVELKKFCVKCNVSIFYKEKK